MHVCFLFHREYPQNFSTAMNEYTTKLAAAGVEVSVIAARRSQETPKRETLNGVKIYRIKTSKLTSVSPEPTVFGFKALRLLDRLCQRQQIDILHMLAFPNLGLILRPMPLFQAPPIVVSDVRGTAVRNRLFDLISRIGLRIQRKLVDETFVIDPRVAENVFGDRSVSFLPLGADFEKFTPGSSPELRKELGFSDDDVVIGYTGSIHTPRRLTRMIQVIERVHDSHPAIKLLVVGGGTDLANLKQYATSAGLRDAIVFSGSVPFERVPEYVNIFDIGFAYVPDIAQYRDQPPLKTVEFLATGLPVLASDTPGNRRFVSHGENAWLVDDEVDAYTDGLSRLINDTALRKRLASNARGSVRGYSYESIVEKQLIPAYERLLSEQDCDSN